MDVSNIKTNANTYDKIKLYVQWYNEHITHNKNNAQFAVNVVFQGDKVQICTGMVYRKPNNKMAKRELQCSGGTIEAGESPEDAAHREMREETWDDIPPDIKKNYTFPVLSHTQKIYFGRNTVIFMHTVSKEQKLYTGDMVVDVVGDGRGEIASTQMIPLADIYKSIPMKEYNGVRWRRCSVWSFKKLRPIFELYTQLDA